MAVKPTTTPPDPFPIIVPPSGAELAYEGDYVPATQYQDGDVVVKDGIAYICVGGPTTVAPDPAPWGAAALTKTNYGTSLPSSPVDGQEAILVDSLTNPTYQWRFRYNAGSTSPYKWEYIGGKAKIFEDGGLSSSAAGTWQDIPGMTFTLPRAGDWILEFGADMYAGTAGAYGKIAPSKAGAAPADRDTIADSSPAGSSGSNSHSRKVLATGLAASAVVKLQQTSNGGSTVSRYDFFYITPVRVS